MAGLGVQIDVFERYLTSERRMARGCERMLVLPDKRLQRKK